MSKINKNNIVKFPLNLSDGEREIEAILFAATEPLEIESIESKISKKINVQKIPISILLIIVIIKQHQIMKMIVKIYAH